MNSLIDPSPFFFNTKAVKAFVLGCDPTNFSDDGKPVQLKFAFGIGEDYRYFNSILQNLLLIGLHLEDIYIQNMITAYQDSETASNKTWNTTAKDFLPARVKEFDSIDPHRSIPVLLTSERLYLVLINENFAVQKAHEMYETANIPIPAAANKLNRPIIPFYRHPRYNLWHWNLYKNRLRQLFYAEANK